MAPEEPGPGQQYAIQARKHIAALRRARLGVTIEIRWCPAHKGIAGNEKADEWAKIAAEKPGTRGVENPGPLPRSLANLKREISEKKWAEARSWAGGRISKAKYCMPKSQKPDSVVADSTQRLASRFYQLKTGHARTGQYLHWAKVRPDTQCWWCKCPSQTRDHLFKVCPEWRLRQKVLWAEVQKETRRWKSRWKIRDLGSARLPHRNGCGKAGATCGRGRHRKPDVRMGAPGAPGAGRGTGGGGGGAGRCGRLGRWGGTTAVLAHTLFYGIGRRGVGEDRCSFVIFLCSFFGAHLLFLGTGLGGGRRGACNVPPPRGLRTGKPGKMYAAIIYIGRMRV